ncbi:glycosyl hydrolase [Lipomyces doorenjongii]|uniref:glycosyl hydrolase n=1 Tax=Lipomyces doorenjongii TaxID=383834 RepID=UPI0034CDF086
MVRPFLIEEYRPQFHFTPEKNWMNDPNGLYNAHGTKWGYISWRHAISTDFVNLNGNIMEMFFSSSAVVDVNNTSGFVIPIGKSQKGKEIFSQPMVTIYTSHYPTAHTTSNGQYNGNPVIPSPPPEYADQYNEFRDPFVFWHSPSSKWIMVATLAMEQTLLIYSSDNLKDWTLEPQFGPYHARFGEWECPSSALCGRVVAGSGISRSSDLSTEKAFVADASEVYDPTKVPADSTVFEDFESTSSTFEELGWTATGDFVCSGPRKASTVNAGKIKGYLGNGIMTTCLSGGYYPYNPVTAGTPEDNQVSMNLVVDGKVVHSQTGTNTENLVWRMIVTDVNPGPAAHLHIDEIVRRPTGTISAPTTMLPNSERTVVGWMNNWAYANDIPTSTWRSATSISRTLALKTINKKARLVRNPYHPFNVPAPYSARMKRALMFTRGTGPKFGVCLRSNATNTQEAVIGYDFLGQNVFVDRFKSGNSSFVDSERNAFPGY